MPNRPVGPTMELLQAELRQLRRLQLASLVEATTLILLVCVCVPLKHLLGWPWGVKVMGPVHGLAFVTYLWIALQTVSEGAWRTEDRIRLIAVSVVPFGGFTNIGLLRRKTAALETLRATL